MSQKALGIIAGMGTLPMLMARQARARGYRVITVALEGLADLKLAEASSDAYRVFNIGKFGGVLEYFGEHGVTEAVFTGKVPKLRLFDGSFRPDLGALKVLATLRDWRDDSLINVVAAAFEGNGIRMLDMKEFCADLLMPEGLLSKRAPKKAEREDVEFGFRMAKAIGELDIGQTVVVKSRAVMAVEAIEGTDEAIKRGGQLGGPGAVVVKVARPRQDMRFDLPTVGADTLEAMLSVGAAVLALEAGKSIFIDREEFLRRADAAGIVVMGVKG